MRFAILITLLLNILFLNSQTKDSIKKSLEISTSNKEVKIDLLFPEKCLGLWEGEMEIYNLGILRHKVKVRFTAAKTKTPNIYIWKTEYLSKKTPGVKDYKLIVDDAKSGRYILDEGNGIKLIQYAVDNKMRCLFEVNNMYFTSITEILDNKLIFEVTSGEKIQEIKGIKNFSFTNVQRMILNKIQ